MPVKVSEKKIGVGMIYLVIGVIILFNTSVIPAPVRLSEEGILYTLPAALFIALGIRSFKRAALKL